MVISLRNPGQTAPVVIKEITKVVTELKEVEKIIIQSPELMMIRINNPQVKHKNILERTINRIKHCYYGK